MIRDAIASDAEAIVGIYNPYVLGTTITFEEEAVGAEEMRARMEKNGRDYAWLVYEEGAGRSATPTPAGGRSAAPIWQEKECEQYLNSLFFTP